LRFAPVSTMRALPSRSAWVSLAIRILVFLRLARIERGGYTMPNAVAELSPTSLWSRFADLTTVPRPSKREEKVRAWVQAWAREHGFERREDPAGNIVVVVPAKPGREGAPVVVVQAHLDMVCEKNRDVEHDFDNDPIVTRIEDGWVVAVGTTLGADNGIGVAAAMAVATDPAVVHGPLELLFTVDEETGMTGAANLDPSIVHGRILLNLDTEEDGELCVGCAGGADSRLRLPLARTGVPAAAPVRSLTLRGLRGGHSGMNIHENRGNAIRLLARILDEAGSRGLPHALIELDGGDKSNAIPREAEALLAIAEGAMPSWGEFLDERRRSLAAELSGIEPNHELALATGTSTRAPLTDASATRLLGLVLALPHGVLGMSPAIPGLVESSSNLAAVHSGDDAAELVASSRSSLAPALESIRASIRAAASLAGASCEVHDAYPGWQPNPSSAVTELLRDVYREVWGHDPEVLAVHAGLECGLLGERIPGLDMISFGPTIVGAHSPDERVEISAVGRFWSALKLALERLSRDDIR
jgi:dipeptidase D